MDRENIRIGKVKGSYVTFLNKVFFSTVDYSNFKQLFQVSHMVSSF